MHDNSVFFRVYVEAINSGMIADMGADRWQTLCVLASFMDANGECFPSQETIANRLGISRQNANIRIKRLLDYRWNGEPIVTARKERVPGSGIWRNTVYTVLPESNLAIFGDYEPQTRHGEHDMGIQDTNYIHV